jgi:hypothetical protein
VLAILGSVLDPSATALVDGWSHAGAALLTAEDLSRPGWSFRVAAPRAGTAVIDGRRIAVSDIRAVVTRRPAVLAEELVFVRPADRPYLAAEMNAFLVAWLTALSCPVLNRPTPRSLSGPAWTSLHWATAAAKVGATWTEQPVGPTHDVVVCGSACLGHRSPEEERAARALVRAADVDLLSVRLCAAGVCGATALPPLACPDVRAAVLDHLASACSCCGAFPAMTRWTRCGPRYAGCAPRPYSWTSAGSPTSR